MEILRCLGQSPLTVSPVGLGCWQFSGGRGLVGGVWARIDQNGMNAIVKSALDGGINWFDTAEVYGDGRSERALAAALSAAGVTDGRDAGGRPVRIATKWWPLFRTARHLLSSFPGRAAALAPHRVGLLQIHQPFSLSSAEKQAAALADLLRLADIDAVGVSNFSGALMRRVHRVLADEGLILASNQVRYSLNHRAVESDGTLETARELGVAVIAWSPLGQGVLTGRFHRDPAAAARVSPFRRAMSGIDPAGLDRTRPLVEALTRIGTAHGASAAQVAVRWLVDVPGGQVFAIPGASRPEQASEAAGVLSLTLSADEWRELDEISRIFH